MRHNAFIFLAALFLFRSTQSTDAQDLKLHLVTRSNTNLTSISGSGDSASPLLSADGRWIFFASTANNLISNDFNGLVFDLFARNLSDHQTFLLTPGIDGEGANGSSMPEAASADGRFLAFSSDASNLVPNDTNGYSDVFVRDRVNNQTILVSAAQNGIASGKGDSRNASITPDGRYVVFESTAKDLTPESGQNLGTDVFLRDLQTGRTTLVSAGYAPTLNTTRTFDSRFPSVTPEGRYVAFVSTATNLVPGAANTQVYVRDVQAGITYWASTNVANFQTLFSGKGFTSYKPVLSADGRYAIFKTYSGDLALDSNVVIFRHDIQAGTTEVIAEGVAGEDPNYDNSTGPDASSDGNIIAYAKPTPDLSREVYVWDAATKKETLISTNLPGIDGDTTLYSDTPLVSGDGRYVVFVSAPFDELSGFRIYQYDRTSAKAQLVNPHSPDSEDGELDVQDLSMSADGRVIAFDSSADDLVDRDSNKSFDVFVKHLDLDAIELISEHDKSVPTVTPNGQSTLAHNGVDGSGRYVVFTSQADDLASGDENEAQDVFVKDLTTGNTLPVSIALDGSLGDGQSRDPAISRNGRYVVFSSVADNLAANDTNNAEDIFLRDLQTGTTTLISASFDHAHSAGGNSFAPSISDDGRFVAFQSFATNLVSDFSVSPSTGSSIFLYDVMAGKCTLASHPSGTSIDDFVTPTISPSGRYVVYQSRVLASLSPATRLYQWFLYDQSTGTNRSIATATSASFPLIDSSSPPVFDRLEHFLAYPFQIAPTTRVENEIGLINLAEAAPSPSQICSNCSTPSISDDGSFISYQTFSSNSISPHGVWVYDRAANQSTAISTNLSSTITDSSGRFDPVISGDGRFVAFQSRTPAPGENDARTFSDVFLFDRNTGETQLISRSPLTGGPGGNSSSAPVFSPDSRMVLFNSYAPDLVSGDYNFDSDIFFVTLDNNPPSSLALKLTLDSGAAIIQWNSVSGQTHQVQYKNELSDATWLSLGAAKAGTGSTVSVTDPAISGSSHRFYRVVVVP